MSSEEDPLMKELGRIAREGESPLDDTNARALLRPFGPEELETMAAGAAHELLGAEKVSPAEATWQGTAGRAAAKGRAQWGRPAAIGAFVLAAAAAVLFWLRTVPPVPAPIASYELVVEGSERPSRSDDRASDTDPIRVRRDGRLVLIARPRTALAAGLSADAVAMIARGEALTAWHLSPQVSAEGAIRIEAAASAIAELPDGASRVVLFVGATAALPKDEDAGRVMRRTPPRGVLVFEREVTVVPR
jgi:hypothetical protein